MKLYPSALATWWIILAADNVWAHQIRGINSNHISHGQNDIRQLEGSDGVGVTVTVDAFGNDVTVSGNWYADAVPPPTTCGGECWEAAYSYFNGDTCGVTMGSQEGCCDPKGHQSGFGPCGANDVEEEECMLCAGFYEQCEACTRSEPGQTEFSDCMDTLVTTNECNSLESCFFSYSRITLFS